MASSEYADIHAPYRLYKSDISYFSGKLEAYMRYKEIPYQAEDVNLRVFEKIGRHTGIKKMPVVETNNREWLFDTTPLMQWFDNIYQQKSILPEDPALRFITLLLEDYGDEWLWRPAMWWRWVPKVSRWALGYKIGAEMLHAVVARPFGAYFSRRQLNEWVWGDGVDKTNSDQVRDMYFRELEFLEALLADQPFLMGNHPSAADYGYFASMFRHFGNDPEPSEIMRRQAPNTYEWLARVWNAKNSRMTDEQTWQWPSAEYWKPLLKRVAEDYLPYLHQNALAFKSEQPRFNFEGKNFTFNNTKTTSYRVYCRQVLQKEFSLLSEGDQQRVNEIFINSDVSLDSLHDDGVIDSGLEEGFQLPITDQSKATFKMSLKTRIFGQPRN